MAMTKGSLERKNTGFVSATTGVERRKSHLDNDSPVTKQPTRRFFDRQASVTEDDLNSTNNNAGEAHMSSSLKCYKKHCKDRMFMSVMLSVGRFLFVGRFLLLFLGVASVFILSLCFLLNSYQDSDNVVIQ